jgi:hypothetical protein
MIRRSGDAVCDPHRTRGGDKKREFSGLASKLVVTVCQWFGHKTTVTISWFGPQNQDRRFGYLSLKIKWEEVCLFAPQTDERMKTV